MTLPHISNVITVRAEAGLPAAGAWDVTPLEIQCGAFDWISFYVSYVRGAAVGGAVDLLFQWSPRAANVVGAENWFTMPVYQIGVLAAGADTQSRIQREFVTYASTSGEIEAFVLGPIEFRNTARRLRVYGRESGVVGTPGRLHIVAIGTQGVTAL